MRIGFWRAHSSSRNGNTSRNVTNGNFDCLRKALEWNSLRGLLYFRVPSTMLPGAGEIACWRRWKDQLEQIGALIRERGIRISMRPGIGIYLSTTSDDQFRRWAVRLVCLSALLDTMHLDSTHKIQIAAESETAISQPASEAHLARFDERFRRLPETVQRRLVVESPDRHFALRDSWKLWSLSGIPIVHRTGSTSPDAIRAALTLCRRTWTEEDGSPSVDLKSPASPILGRLLADAPEADYMLESDRLPKALLRRMES